MEKNNLVIVSKNSIMVACVYLNQFKWFRDLQYTCMQDTFARTRICSQKAVQTLGRASALRYGILYTSNIPLLARVLGFKVKYTHDNKMFCI